MASTKTFLGTNDNSIVSTSSTSLTPPQQRSWAEIVKGTAATKEECPAASSLKVAGSSSSGPSAPVAAASQVTPEPAQLALQPVQNEREEHDVEVEVEVPARELQPLQPAARSSWRCKCLGEVLVMLRTYGWIAPLEPINHPDASKNGGRIYVAARDIEGGLSLRPGDRVSFYLYVDHLGLGAEVCRLMSPEIAVAPAKVHNEPWQWRHAGPCTFPADVAKFVAIGATGASNFSADALESVPACVAATRPCSLSADAMEFVPDGTATTRPGGLSSDAEEFVLNFRSVSTEPGTPQFVPSAAAPCLGAEPVLHSTLQLNAAYVSDSDTDGVEGGDEAWSQCSEGEDSRRSDDDLFGVDGRPGPCRRGGGSGKEVLKLRSCTHAEAEPPDDAKWDNELGVVVVCAPLKVAGGRASSLDGCSTSAEGEGSDSEADLSDVMAPLCRVCAPPGLSLLDGV